MDSTVLPDDFPDFLKHSDQDTPVPTWQQITRTADSRDAAFVAHISQIVSGSNDERTAMETWDSWAGNSKRSTALLLDKINHEGWLDSVGPIKGWPWDGGFFFWPRHGEDDLARVLSEKSVEGGGYIECNYRAGLTAMLAKWNHKGWKQGWVETDSPFASLHVGIFGDGSAEVHLDVFNPLYVSGAPRSQIMRAPLIGAFNYGLFRLHRRWEHSKLGSVSRTSANFYHLMLGRVPLSF
jgi:hypothetical protein